MLCSEESAELGEQLTLNFIAILRQEIAGDFVPYEPVMQKQGRRMRSRGPWRRDCSCKIQKALRKYGNKKRFRILVEAVGQVYE